MRTRVKICGITRPEDAVIAVDAGADAVGMVFYEPSPRYVDIEQAVSIAARVPAFVTLVGLFVNASHEAVSRVLDSVPLQLLQFHGDESPDFCDQFEKDYIRALRVGQTEGGLFGDDLRTSINSFKRAKGVLLDTYKKGLPGGTGENFDWELVPGPDDIEGMPVILAGGLQPDNVGSAIRAVRPYAVDVSGGVESAPGIKDADRIRAFLMSARTED